MHPLLLPYKNKLLAVLFFLILLAPIWFSMSSISLARSPHLDYFHFPPNTRKAPKLYYALQKQLNWWFYKRRLQIPQADKGLREAAWLLSRRLYKRPLQHLPHNIVQAALWMGGVTDQRIRIFAMAFQNEAKLKRALNRSLSNTIAGLRPNFYGMAIYGKKKKICVILALRRAVQLQPFPRWLRRGQRIVFKGKLLPGFKNPRVIIGSAGQKHIVQRALFLDKKNRFQFHWKAQTFGDVRFQISVEDGLGPWTATQWNLNTEPPTLRQHQIIQYTWKQYKKQLWRTPAPVKKAPTKNRSFTTKQDPKRNKKLTLQMLDLTNRYRRSMNLSLLKRDKRLDRMASAHALDMVKDSYFAHTSPLKGSFAKRFLKLKWRVKKASENIVVGISASNAFQLLLNSPVHRSNIQGKSFRKIGIGVASHPSGRLYFVQVFVTPIPQSFYIVSTIRTRMYSSLADKSVIMYTGST